MNCALTLPGAGFLTLLSIPGPCEMLQSKVVCVLCILMLTGCVHSEKSSDRPICVTVRHHDGVRHEICDFNGRVELRTLGAVPDKLSARHLQQSLAVALPELEARKKAAGQ